MDGYVIARLESREAEDIFALPQVRHVAELADGNTFIAFDGELPYEGGTIFEVEQGAQDFFFPMPKIRRVAPLPGVVEYLSLYSAAAFGFVARVPWMQASMVGCDLVLACTPTPPLGVPIWTSFSERILDKRLEGALV